MLEGDTVLAVGRPRADQAEKRSHRFATGREHDRFKQFAWGLAVLTGRGLASSRAIGWVMSAVARGKLDWLDPGKEAW